MGATELIATAASFSLLAGWRLYASLLVAGLAIHFGWLPLPEHLKALQVLANPWILGVAGIATIAEFFADKVPWLDSIWDAVHSFARPVGGALLALAIVDPSDVRWQVAALLLGGGGALLTHGAKATTRAAVNMSPEPASNLVMSGVGDLTTAGGLALALTHPLVALTFILIMVVLLVALAFTIRHFMRRALRKILPPEPPPA